MQTRKRGEGDRRNPKFETISNFKCPKQRGRPGFLEFEFRDLNLFRISGFEFGISVLQLLHQPRHIVG
jgi:hypothetical protein